MVANTTDHDSAKILPREIKLLYGIYDQILASYPPGVEYLTSAKQEETIRGSHIEHLIITGTRWERNIKRRIGDWRVNAVGRQLEVIAMLKFWY